jgi:hypothetical protein
VPIRSIVKALLLAAVFLFAAWVTGRAVLAALTEQECTKPP